MTYYDRQGRMLPDKHAAKWEQFVTKVYELADEILGEDAGILIGGGFDHLGEGENEISHVMSTNLSMCGAFSLVEMMDDDIADAHDEFHGRGVSAVLTGQEALNELPEEMRDKVVEHLREMGIPVEQLLVQTRIKTDDVNGIDDLLDAWTKDQPQAEDEVEHGE